MATNLELIQGLIKEAENISYKNGQKDAVEKRAEMLLRKIFGDTTHYLKALKDIEFRVLFSGAPESLWVEKFNNGKKQLLNLLNVVAEDLQLDMDSDELKKSEKSSIPNSNNVFIVHGHNEEMKLSVARTIEKLKLNPIILHEQASKGKTIIEKFTDNSDIAAFAIVLLSADDVVYNKNENSVSAKFRARQNVIFELGYFIGKLGRERVLALHETDVNLEIPSDYTGVLFVPFDKAGKWKFDLVKELKAIGISVDANDVI
jgi:predicted nucleotide-binding protein